MIKSLKDFKAYNLAMEIGEQIWNIVKDWNYFEKPACRSVYLRGRQGRDTVGKQLVRAADSIAANLSEGLGRYHYKETKNFSYYSRGSLFETRTWLAKASTRKLVSQIQFSELESNIEVLGKMINGYINSIGI